MNASASTSGLRSAVAAMLIMAIGMGFGRFAYTAIYPHMVQEGLLSLDAGSLAASVNYAGYLLGALLALRVRPASALRLCLWMTAGTAACLLLLALVEMAWVIIAVRGIAGVCSALAMIAASLWLLEQRKHGHGAPLLYAGVGLGIALSAELVVLADSWGLPSREQWLLLGCFSLILAGLTLPGLRDQRPVRVGGQHDSGKREQVQPRPLVLIYGLAGFGYIITATYLPLLVKSVLPELNSAHVWAVFGLGAVPACFLWHRIDQRLGTHRALALNLIIQALGVLLPVLLPNGVGYLGSALLVGGTFTGTVTIAMPAGQRIARQARGNLLASMTVTYSIGQIIGPLLASAAYGISQSVAGSLWIAGGALVLGAWLSLTAL